MKIIKRILLAVDGTYDRQAFIGEAATVAIDAGAQVTLLSVLDAPSGNQKMSTETAELLQWMKEDSLEQMKDISSELEKREIKVTIKQSNGKHYLEIIREAKNGGYDLVMKPAKSNTTAKDIIFGTTDMELFRMCPCPVWIFKPTRNTELRKIMIAVDLLPGDQEKSGLADMVLQWGKHVADLVNAELHVIHVWNLYGEATLRGRSGLAYSVDKMVQDEEKNHRLWLNEALAKNGVAQKEIKIHFYRGDANNLIPEKANALQIDLLVMGTVGRGGVPGFSIGNTADSVVRQAGCSVLAIKPEDFLTPVKVD